MPLTVRDSAGITVRPGDQLTGRDGKVYEFVEAVTAPTAAAFGKVRMRKVTRGMHDFTAITQAIMSDQVFADIAFDLTVSSR
jgi:hypothetical protein